MNYSEDSEIATGAVAAASPTADELKGMFYAALSRLETGPGEKSAEAQDIIDKCCSKHECFSNLISIISNYLDLDESVPQNEEFLLHLLMLVSKKGELFVNMITGFENILTLLTKKLSNNPKELELSQLLSMECVTNLSKCKAAKIKLAQVSGFVSQLCATVRAGSSEQLLQFSVAVLSRLLDCIENRIKLDDYSSSFRDPTFYESIGCSSALIKSAEEKKQHDACVCRLILYISRLDHLRIPIAQSTAIISLLTDTIVSKGHAGVSLMQRHAVVAVMNLASCPNNRSILSKSIGLLEGIVGIASKSKGKVIQYSMALLSNLAWMDCSKTLYLDVPGLLDTVVNAVYSLDQKTSMYAVGVLFNLSTLENNQTSLIHKTRSDILGAIVHVIRRGSGLTQDDAVACLANLSVAKENRFSIAKSMEKLQDIFKYIRDRSGNCRHRAISLLNNLSISFCSADVLIRNEHSLEAELQSLANTVCEAEPENMKALKIIAERLSHRACVVADSRVSSPRSRPQTVENIENVRKKLTLEKEKKSQESSPASKHAAPQTVNVAKTPPNSKSSKSSCSFIEFKKKQQVADGSIEGSASRVRGDAVTKTSLQIEVGAVLAEHLSSKRKDEGASGRKIEVEDSTVVDVSATQEAVPKEAHTKTQRDAHGVLGKFSSRHGTDHPVHHDNPPAGPTPENMATGKHETSAKLRVFSPLNIPNHKPQARIGSESRPNAMLQNETDKPSHSEQMEPKPAIKVTEASAKARKSNPEVQPNDAAGQNLHKRDDEKSKKPFVESRPDISCSSDDSETKHSYEKLKANITLGIEASSKEVKKPGKERKQVGPKRRRTKKAKKRLKHNAADRLPHPEYLGMKGVAESKHPHINSYSHPADTTFKSECKGNDVDFNRLPAKQDSKNVFETLSDPVSDDDRNFKMVSANVTLLSVD